jgi:phosphinothricin acetyltransferase
MLKNPDWTIRQATRDDAGAVAEIYNHYVEVGGSTFDCDPWTPVQAASHIESEPPDVWFVASEKGSDPNSAKHPKGRSGYWGLTPFQILGWASVRRYSLRSGYRLTCETAIYLSPESIGTGVADALQHRVDEYCGQQGMHHAVAKIIADNQRSISFHHRHGYELVGIQKEIGRIDNHWVDVAILQKIYPTS